MRKRTVASRKRILLATSCLLLALLCASFVRDCAGGRQTRAVTALLNPKHRADVSRIDIAFADGSSIALFLMDAFWCVGRGDVVMPADTSVVSQLLDMLSAPQELLVVSDGAQAAGRLGFGRDSVHVALRDSRGEMLSELQLVVQEEARRVYVRGAGSDRVYGVPFGKKADFLASYAAPGMQSWAEPLLLPLVSLGLSGGIQAVNGNPPCDDFLLRARHGPVLETVFHERGEPLSVLRIELGGGGGCFLRFYAVPGEDEFVVAVPEFFSDTSSGGSRYALDYAVTISAWTYGRIMESAGVGAR